jgi:hypothetical protein
MSDGTACDAAALWFGSFELLKLPHFFFPVWP